MSSLLRPFALSALAAIPCAAQDATAILGSARGPIQASQVSVKYFNPIGFDANELAESAGQLFGSEIQVTGEPLPDGSETSVTLPHFVVLRNTIVIRDAPDAAAQIAKLLGDLDQSERQHMQDMEKRSAEEAAAATAHELAEQQRDLETRGQVADSTIEIRPRYVSLDTLFSALAPFQRDVTFCSNGRAAWTTINISQVPDAQLLVLSESQDRIEQMRGLIDQIDRPQPQAVVSVTLIRASDKGNDSNLPKDLVENLKSLIPYGAFEPLSIGVLRCSLATGQQSELQMDLGEKGGATFSFVPAAFNPDTGEIALSQCNFNLQLNPDHENGSASSQSFTTHLTFKSGEYVVLGAVGLKPVFVVLRAELVRKNA